MPEFTSPLPRPLVDVDWLAKNLTSSNVVVFDASVPPVVPGFLSINKDGSFRSIPGARRFDYDKEICRPGSSLPHMMPDPELFQEKVRALGVNQESVIVVYDDVGLYASPRAWWMLRAMGHEQVAVLNGGLPAWIAAENEVESSLRTDFTPGNFTANWNKELFCDSDAVLRATSDEQTDIIDARSAGRFFGTAPEPRPGCRSGHMPSALNLPFANVLRDGHLRSEDEVTELFEAITDKDKNLITSCGSGITACVLTLAAAVAGFPKLSVYDGSWAEWGMEEKLPVVTD
ncbi:MAG: sulfurtransferase [Pseudohongiellaceae bacterium]